MRRGLPPVWKHIALHGGLLAVGMLLLQWLDHRWMLRRPGGEWPLFLVAMGFLGFGVYLGLRVFGTARPPPFDGNPQAVASLGISPRELTVLQALAEGQSNKEIARLLEVSPNTVKTHVARLYDKLGARRRTEAIHRARELGILP